MPRPSVKRRDVRVTEGCRGSRAGSLHARGSFDAPAGRGFGAEFKCLILIKRRGRSY